MAKQCRWRPWENRKYRRERERNESNAGVCVGWVGAGGLGKKKSPKVALEVNLVLIIELHPSPKADSPIYPLIQNSVHPAPHPKYPRASQKLRTLAPNPAGQSSPPYSRPQTSAKPRPSLHQQAGALLALASPWRPHLSLPK